MMRTRTIVFLVCALAATGLVGTLLILGARSDQRLKASLQRVDEILAATAAKPLAEPAAPGEPTTTVPPDESNAGWRELFEQIDAWLVSTRYGLSPIPPLYRQYTEVLPAPPAAPEELIAAIRRLARLGGPADPPTDLSDRNAWHDHWRDLRNCAVLTAEHAKIMMEQERYAEVAEDLLTAMKVADVLTLEPLGSAQEVRHELYSAMQAYLQVRRLPAECSAPLIEHLAHAGSRSNLRTALSGELKEKLALYEDWKGLGYGEAVDEAGLYWGTRSWLWSQDICRPWFNLDQQCYADVTVRMLEVSDAPFHEIAPELQAIEVEISQTATPNQVVRDSLQDTTRLFADQAMHEARLDIMRLGLAIEEYFAREGQYPSSLDALAARFGGTLPRDPFTGESYRYTLDENGFFLYAEGPGDGEGPAWRGTGARAPEAPADASFGAER
jgi:hypothetical protein